MSIQTAQPLPECALCENPVLRETHERNGGLCDGCARGIAETVRMLPVRRTIEPGSTRRQRILDERPPVLDNPTVFVERYVPPVPRQVDE